MVRIDLRVLGHLRLDKIRAHHLNAFYLNLMEEGIRGDVMYRCDRFKDITKAAGKTAAALAEETGLGIRTLYSLNACTNFKAQDSSK